MEHRYETILTRVLDQNALILNSVSRMQEDIQSLRTKLDNLETQAQPITISSYNTEDSQSELPVAGGDFSLPFPFPHPHQFHPQQQPFLFNPFVHPMYSNPYAMMSMPAPPEVNNTVLNPSMFGNFPSFGQENKPQETPLMAAAAASTISTKTNATDSQISNQSGDMKGSWNCVICSTANIQDNTSCVCCRTLKDVSSNNLKSQQQQHSTPPPTTNNNMPLDNAINVTSPPKFSFGLPTPSSSIAATTTTTTAKNVPSFSFGTSVLPSTTSSSSTTTNTFSWTPSFVANSSSSTTATSSSATSSSSLFQTSLSSTTFSFTAPTPKSFPDSSTSSIPSPGTKNINTIYDAEEVVEDFVPTIEFQPVIPLPPLQEVIKGDENENVLFEHRAKLLRFVSEIKEWKERGLGEIKILQSKDNEKKIRVVMWREKVHKIACNHWIARDMEITNYQGSLKNLMWTALDFAEGEEGPKTEIFVCRFGQEEKAQEFKREMEKAIEIVRRAPITPERPQVQVAPVPAPSVAQVPLSQLFKKTEGEWNCDACYCTNTKGNVKCLSCDTPKPGTSSSSTLQQDEQDVSTLHNPPCRGCDPDSFDFSKLDGREVPNFEDIPKPSRTSTASVDDITLKNLLISTPAPPTSSTTTSIFGEKQSSTSLSNFSFTLPTTPSTVLPSETTTTTTTTSSPFPSNNFSFTFSNENSIFGGSTAPLTLNPLTLEDHEGGEEYEDEEEEDDTMYESDGHVLIKTGEGDFKDYGDGQISIVYDGDYYCARFVFQPNNDDDVVIEHFIASETIVKSTGENTFEWDFINLVNNEKGDKSRIRVVFPDQQAYDEFSSVVADSVEMAVQACVSEQDLADEFQQNDD